MNRELNKISKYLSYLLRHEPQAIQLELDKNGWASIEELIEKTITFELDSNLVQIVVETSDKKRFSISDDGLFIRANQGHSIAVDLDLEALKPPEILTHGTAERFMEAIQTTGLSKMERHHVHLTESVAVAKNVGARYGKPVILNIAAQNMYEDGFEFFKSANNVWLVDSVPTKYITKM